MTLFGRRGQAPLIGGEGGATLRIVRSTRPSASNWRRGGCHPSHCLNSSLPCSETSLGQTMRRVAPVSPMQQSAPNGWRFQRRFPWNANAPIYGGGPSGKSEIRNPKFLFPHSISSHLNHIGWLALYHSRTSRMSSFLSGGRTVSSMRSKWTSMWSSERYSMASEHRV